MLISNVLVPTDLYFLLVYWEPTGFNVEQPSPRVLLTCSFCWCTEKLLALMLSSPQLVLYWPVVFAGVPGSYWLWCWAALNSCFTDLQFLLVYREVTGFDVEQPSTRVLLICSFCWCTGKLPALMLSSPQTRVVLTCSFCWCTGKLLALMLSSPPLVLYWPVVFVGVQGSYWLWCWAALNSCCTDL